MDPAGHLPDKTGPKRNMIGEIISSEDDISQVVEVNQEVEDYARKLIDDQSDHQESALDQLGADEEDIP